ncbi:MAG: hypothetical protein KDD70_04580 [Bdellovibrionales bacterium]|nr:hypothetical protein [Bdellovibrionales bacterium]
MLEFKTIRGHIVNRYQITDDGDLSLRIILEVGEIGRTQGIALCETERGDGSKYLYLNTPVAEMRRIDPKTCLKINLMQPIGHLALTDIEDTPYVVMCHMMPYNNLTFEDLDYTIHYLAATADRLENGIMDGEDLY